MWSSSLQVYIFMNSQMSHSKKAQAVIQPKNILMFTQKVPLQVLRMWKRTGLLDHNF